MPSYPRLLGKLWEYSPNSSPVLMDTPKYVSRADITEAIRKGIRVEKPAPKKRGKQINSRQLVMTEVVNHKDTKDTKK